MRRDVQATTHGLHLPVAAAQERLVHLLSLRGRDVAVADALLQVEAVLRPADVAHGLAVAPQPLQAPQRHWRVHRERHQLLLNALGLLRLHGLAAQEGRGGLQLAREPQPGLQRRVVGADVGVPVAVALGGTRDQLQPYN